MNISTCLAISLILEVKEAAKANDLAPFAGTVGGDFHNFLTGYAIKKVIKLAAIIVGLFFAALAYFQYQR